MNVEPGRLVWVEAETFDVRKQGVMWYRRLVRKGNVDKGSRGRRG